MEAKIAENGPKLKNSLLISLFAGNLPAETRCNRLRPPPPSRRERRLSRLALEIPRCCGLSQRGAGLQARQEAGEGRFRAECLGVTNFCFLWDFRMAWLGGNGALPERRVRALHSAVRTAAHAASGKS